MARPFISRSVAQQSLIVPSSEIQKQRLPRIATIRTVELDRTSSGGKGGGRVLALSEERYVGVGWDGMGYNGQATGTMRAMCRKDGTIAGLTHEYTITGIKNKLVR